MYKRPPAFLLRASVTSFLSAFALLSSATAQTTLYWGGGTSDRNPGGVSIDTTSASTGNLSGTWDATTTNWNTSTSATSGYQAWVDGIVASFSSASTSQATLNGAANVSLASDFNVAGINAAFATNAKSQSFLLLGSTGEDRIVTLANNGVFSVVAAASNSDGFAFGRANQVTAGQGAAILAGNNFTLNGATVPGGSIYNPGASLSIYSNSTISGTARVNGGILNVGIANGTASAGSLANISRYDIIGQNSILQITQGGGTNAVKDDAVIHLAGGQLQLTPNANTIGLNETVGKIIVEGYGNIVTTARINSPTVASTLTVTDGFDRGDNGKGVLFVTSSNTTQGLGTVSGLNLNSNGFAAASSSFIAYGLNIGKGVNSAGETDTTTTTSVRFLATDSSGKLGVTDSVVANTTLAPWDTTYGSTSDLHLENTTATGSGYLTGSLDANTSIRSLAIAGAGSSVGSLTIGTGNTLRIDAIGFTSGGSAILNIGATANDGFVTANGNAGGDVYFLMSQGNRVPATYNVNTVITDNGGAVNAVFVNGGPFGGSAVMNVNGANTYTGKTYINGGIIKFSAANSLSTTSEVNIATGAGIDTTLAARVFGGGAINQRIAGGGASAGQANVTAASRTITIGALGTLAPGDTGANETFYFSFSSGKLAFTSGATLALDFGAVASSDQISFTGSANNYLSGSGLATLDVTSGAGFGYGVGYTYTVFSNVTTSDFTFGTIKLNGATLNASDYTWAQDGNNYIISFTGSAIPEPSTYAAFVGLAALGFVAYHRRRRA